VVQYLYVHRSGDSFRYPSSREGSGDPDRLAVRYLECALVQAASLRLRETECEIALVTNVADRQRLGRAAAELLGQIEALDVSIVLAEYAHAPSRPNPWFAASRYVFDAIVATAARQQPARPLWFVDVDCVWISPERAFAALPDPPAVGCVEIPYPPDWGTPPNRQSIGQLAQRMGAAPGPPPPWVGGELLAGRAGDLLALVEVCTSLEGELTRRGVEVYSDEQLLTLASALGRVPLESMGHAMRRIWTGPRHGAPTPQDPGALAVWHLPSEKGLGFRRAARALAAGRGDRLRRDLEDPRRAMRRFNVEGGGPIRRARDDLWLLKQRGLDAARSRARR
jgi:hypothetical protein